MENRKMKISLILNIIIVIFTAFATILMFTGIKFMEGEDLLESTKVGMFKFFTVDSNLFMGIMSLVFALEEIKIIRLKKSEIGARIYIMKFAATSAVALTFITVFGYLAHISPGGVYSMIRNSNLFFHLLIPLFSIICFAIFERTDKIKFKYTFFGIIFTVIYSLYYLINVLVHIEEGKVSPQYDWYWFVQGGLYQIFIVFPLMLVISYVISLIIWRVNRKKV